MKRAHFSSPLQFYAKLLRGLRRVFNLHMRGRGFVLALFYVQLRVCNLSSLVFVEHFVDLALQALLAAFRSIAV